MHKPIAWQSRKGQTHTFQATGTNGRQEFGWSTLHAHKNDIESRWGALSMRHPWFQKDLGIAWGGACCFPVGHEWIWLLRTFVVSSLSSSAFRHNSGSTSYPLGVFTGYRMPWSNTDVSRFHPRICSRYTGKESSLGRWMNCIVIILFKTKKSDILSLQPRTSIHRINFRSVLQPTSYAFCLHLLYQILDFHHPLCQHQQTVGETLIMDISWPQEWQNPHNK